MPASAAGFATHSPGSSVDRTNQHLGANAGLNVYLTRHFAVTAGVGYGYSVLHDIHVDQKSHALDGSLGIGVRAGDARFDLSYTFAANDVAGTFAPLRWGSARLSGFIVIDRRFTLGPSGRLFQGGAEGSLDLGFYATPEFGLLLGGFGERGELFSDPIVATRYGGDAGLSYWVNTSARVSAFYVLTFTDLAPQASVAYSSHEVDHQLSLALELRLP